MELARSFQYGIHPFFNLVFKELGNREGKHSICTDALVTAEQMSKGERGS